MSDSLQLPVSPGLEKPMLPAFPPTHTHTHKMDVYCLSNHYWNRHRKGYNETDELWVVTASRAHLWESELSMLACVCNPSTWGTEAGGLQEFLSHFQLGLHVEFEDSLLYNKTLFLKKGHTGCCVIFIPVLWGGWLPGFCQLDPSQSCLGGGPSFEKLSP